MMKPAFLILSLLLCVLTLQAQTKKVLTSTLQQVGLNRVDTLKPGSYAYKVSGHRMVVRVGDAGVVEHVGIPLFPSKMRTQMPSPVYDFLEYTLLKKTLSLSGDNMRINSVSFKKGNWNTLLSVTDNMQCNINNNMGRLYDVTWYDTDKIVASVSFPIQYDLLLLSNKEELENILIADLRNSTGALSDYTIKAPDSGTFSSEYDNKKIFMLAGDTYLKNSITNNLYYMKKGQSYRLFASSQYPAESLANILLRADKSLPKAYVTLRVVKYDGTVETVEFTMADWISCMAKYDCQCYYGFDKENDGKSTAVLYASNPKSGYDHVLMLECNTDQLDQSVVHLSGTAYLFSPTSNVKNMFYKYKK